MKTIRKQGSGGFIKEMKGEAARPPKVKAGVANDLYEKGPRSAVMPRPTSDTKYTKGKRP
jgi:hypothetical protein